MVAADPFDDDDDVDERSRREHPVALSAGDRRPRIIAQLVYVGFSSVALGALMSVIVGPPMLGLVSRLKLSSAAQAMSINAAGCIVGVALSLLCIRKMNALALMPLSLAVSASVTVVLPYCINSFNSLVLIFIQGVLIGVIDRVRFMLCQSRLETGCRTVLLIYLCTSVGAAVPMVFCSTTIVPSSVISENVAGFMGALQRRSSNVTGDVVTPLRHTNLTTAAPPPPPQKPKVVDASALETKQTYAQRKEQMLKEIKAVGMSTTVGSANATAEEQTTTTIGARETASVIDNNSANDSNNVPLKYERIVSAFMTAAAMGYAVVVLMVVCCLLLLCTHQTATVFLSVNGSTRSDDDDDDPRRSIGAARRESSPHGRMALFLSMSFAVLIGAAEAMLFALVMVYVSDRYGGSNEVAVDISVGCWLFHGLGRFAAAVAVKEASGRAVAVCLAMALLIAAGTVFDTSRSVFAILVEVAALLLGPVWPTAFAWLHRAMGHPKSFVGRWLISAHLGRLLLPLAGATLMQWQPGSKDLPFMLISTILASVVLLIPLDKALRQFGHWASTRRRRSTADDAARRVGIAYSKLANGVDAKGEDDEIVHFDRRRQSNV